MENPKIYVIIITFNFTNWLEKCIDSILSSTIKVEILIVDNGSTDETISILSRKYKDIIILRQTENLGFAKANNIGIKYAYDHGADYFFLLNQDTYIYNNTIEDLLSASLKNTDYGILSPIHLNGSGTKFDAGFLKYLQNFSNLNSVLTGLYFKEDIICDSNFVNAAAWFVTRKCISICGGFDTLLFKHYGEDDNYCQRVLYHKLKIGIVLKTAICHDREFRTSQKLPLEIEIKKKYGNINFDFKQINFPLLWFIKMLFIDLLQFKINKIKENFIIYKNLHSKNIKKSREINKSIGLNWL